MSARRTLQLAACWLPVLLLTTVSSIAAAIPFTGGTATAMGVTVAGLVLIAGLALEPRRKDTR